MRLHAHIITSETLTDTAIAIAGIGVGIRCEHPLLAGHVRQRYKSFLADGLLQLQIELTLTANINCSDVWTPSFSLDGRIAHVIGPDISGWIDIEGGRAHLEVGLVQPLAAIDYFLRVAYALLGFRAGGLLLHAAGIARKGSGYLFLGPSGAGKTTVARVSNGDVILNDDLVLLMPRGDGWIICATPFWNPTQVAPNGNGNAPLTAMFRLVQAPQVTLECVDNARAIVEIVAQAPVIPLDPHYGAQVLRRTRDILTAAPLRRLHFLPDNSFWKVVAP